MKAKIFLVVVIFALCVVPTCFAQEQIRL